MALKLLDPVRFLVSICSERSYFIQLGNEKDYRLVYGQVEHANVQQVGRDEKGVCLVMKELGLVDKVGGE